jgi:hypothetical protein
MNTILLKLKLKNGVAPYEMENFANGWQRKVKLNLTSYHLSFFVFVMSRVLL